MEQHEFKRCEAQGCSLSFVHCELCGLERAAKTHPDPREVQSQ